MASAAVKDPMCPLSVTFAGRGCSVFVYEGRGLCGVVWMARQVV